MKKLSIVLLVTLLLGLCSCAPIPKGVDILDINDPQYIELSYIENTTQSAVTPIHHYVKITDTADMEAILDLLGGLTLTETESQDPALNHYNIHIQGANIVRNITISGSVLHCEWTGKVYRADKDITEELKGYLTRDVGTMVDVKELLNPETITRITVTNTQWEEIEMADITQAVDALSTVTLTRSNPLPHEGGVQAYLYYENDRMFLNFSGTTVWIDGKAYTCNTDISQIFSKIIHPES